jgi:hypothetical protein
VYQKENLGTVSIFLTAKFFFAELSTSGDRMYENITKNYLYASKRL